MERQISWQVHYLKSKEIELKQKALKAHRSQYISNAKHLLSFVRNNELFGDFPTIELHRVKSPRFFYNRTEELKDAVEEEKFIKVGDNALVFSVKLSRHPVRKTGLSVYAFGYRADQPFPNTPKLHIKFGEKLFVGIEEEFIKIGGESLVFSLKLSRPLTKETGASIYVFGYRVEQPFPDMPKIHVKFGERKHIITDKNHPLPPDAVQVIRETRQLTFEIPLKILGNPQKIFIGARTYLFSDIPLDWLPWRIIEVNI